MLKGLEVFSMVAFMAYLVLQIFHSRWMWYCYIPSCLAQAILYFSSHTWAFALLNVYFIVMGFVGIRSWKRDSERKAEGDESIILNRMGAGTAMLSLGIVIVGIPSLYFILRGTGDARPLLDALTTVLSIIATWWLTRSYIWQWFLWILSDIFAVALNVKLGMYFLVAQFAFCILMSTFGYFNWRKKGKYLA